LHISFLLCKDLASFTSSTADFQQRAKSTTEKDFSQKINI